MIWIKLLGVSLFLKWSINLKDEARVRVAAFISKLITVTFDAGIGDSQIG